MTTHKMGRVALLEQTLWKVVKAMHGHKGSHVALTEKVDRIVQPVLFPLKADGKPAPGAVRRAT